MTATQQNRVSNLAKAVTQSTNSLQYKTGGELSLEALKEWNFKLKAAVKNSRMLIREIEKHYEDFK